MIICNISWLDILKNDFWYISEIESPSRGIGLRILHPQCLAMCVSWRRIFSNMEVSRGNATLILLDADAPGWIYYTNKLGSKSPYIFEKIYIRLELCTMVSLELASSLEVRVGRERTHFASISSLVSHK